MMKCEKCGSTYIGRTYSYTGTYIITQFNEQISNNLYPVPSGKYWRCLECNNKIKKCF